MNTESNNGNQLRAGLTVRSGIWLGIGIGILLSLSCLAVIAAGIWIDNTDTTADCHKRGSSIADLLRVQMFAPSAFQRSLWTQSFSSSPNRVTKTWLASDLSAVSYLEYLIYNCGYQQSDVDAYYSDENFKTVLFQSYQNVEKKAECKLDKLEHFEFTASYKKENYIMYYWIKQEDSTHILSFMLAFPQKEQAQLQTYARRVYPDLAACP